MTVTAEDESGLSDTATVSIGITDVNEAPSFDGEEYTFTVAENAATGTSAGIVSATDPEEDTLTYGITAGDDDGKFSIDSGGTLSVDEVLDYESSASYTLTVEATDPGGLSDTVAVSIGVTDVNEAPSFDAAEYAFTVAEDAAVGASVGSVSATDPDEDTVTYSITAGDDDGKFSIDSSGAISVAEALDYESSPAHTLTVEATDAGGLSDTATVSIEITDVNEAPSFGADEYTFTVPENSAIAHSVGTAAATDPDEGDTLTYSISAGNDEGAFAIGGSTGSITVADALDYETTVAYKLTVEVSDGRGGAATATLRISVGDVAEDGPPPPTVTYAYNVAAGTFGFNWTVVPGADRYRAQYRVGGAEGAWTNLDATTETSQTFRPEGGVECGTTYEFRLQSHGDGETYPAVWGTRTGGITYDTPARNNAP